MKRNFFSILLFLWAGTMASAQTSPEAVSPVPATPPAGPSHRGDWKPVEKILGQCGTGRGDALELAFPRTDLNVVVEGIPLQPEAGLTSRVCFRPLAHGAGMTGELVLLDQEVPRVLAQLVREGDLEVSAIQHPFLYESPAIETLRVTGRGSPTRLAGLLKDLLAVTGTPLGPPGDAGRAPLDSAAPGPAPSGVSQAGPIAAGAAHGKGKEPDWSQVESILGKGDLQDGVLAYDLPSIPSATGAGAETAVGTGMNPFLRLQQSGRQVAAVGELVLTGDRVNPVIEALTRHRMTVTDVNSPFGQGVFPVFFLRFWALGDAAQVAEGLRATLEAARPSPPK